jgi:Rrf2 family transcriptional regulator, nitric oxide-sensitive transcriptional repressor
MRLTDYTDYALRVLMYLGMRPARLVTIQEIATAHGISKNHLTKVVHHLGVMELVETVRGRSGGIRLGRAPGEIVLGAVVRATEPDFTMVECFDMTQNRCSLSPVCALKNALAGATGAYLQTLDRMTLLDILCGLPAGDRRPPSLPTVVLPTVVLPTVVPPTVVPPSAPAFPTAPSAKSLTCLKAEGHAEA